MAEQTPGEQNLQAVLRQSLHQQRPQPPVPAATPLRPSTSPAALPQTVSEGAVPASTSEVAELRDAVSDDIVEADEQEPLADETARRERARSLVAERVAAWAVKRARSETPLTQAQVEALTQAVFDAIFHAGPLQKYLDDPNVENIAVLGDDVQVDYFNQATVTVAPVAHSSEELIALINRLASMSGHRERRLSSSTPMVSFRLPDGARAEATIMTPVPFLGVRRHGRSHATLDLLQQWGTLSNSMATFLSALVEARMNILIAGDMGTGKTTLLGALGKEIGAEERIVTMETDRELFLDEYKGGAQFLAMEARESNGEIVNGTPVGQITLEDMFPHALRMLATRVIVGEVRGKEAIAMLEAMSAGGSGSMCTLHAAYPKLVLPRLVTLCRGLHREEVHELVGTGINFIVYVKQINQTRIGGRRHRFVSHILEVSPGEHGRPAVQEIFAPVEGEVRGVPHRVPGRIKELEELADFDRRWLTLPQYGGWAQPLDLVQRRRAA
ncbi:CpaF family protein [Streptomyces sp. NPDC055059]|uniref:CpaF family protein n=1 Tax=Streptomyces sp. NPDC005373 TaxID=3156879 RepID=UPI0033B6B25F